MFYHFVMYRIMRKVWKWSSPTFWGKIYAAIMLFRHVQLKVTKLSRNVDIIYYFVTVQVCAKSVNMVTATFRSKFLQQSSSSVTMKSNKAFPNVDIVYYFVTVQVCAKSVNMVTATFRS